MKNFGKGIPCNETRHTLKSKRNRIHYHFVTNNGRTPTTCTIGIGDTDPKTGEPITDMTFFKEYYKMQDHDIYSYWKERRIKLTPAEKKRREEKKNEFITDFENRYGYRPSETDLCWMTDDFMPEHYSASIEWYRDQEDKPEANRIQELSIPCEDPFGDDETIDIFQLKEFASGLTGLQADLYEWLLVKYAGGKVKLSMKDIADRWKICLAQAYKEKDELVRMIKDAVKPVWD